MFPGAALTSIGISSWAGQVALYTNLVVTGGDMTFTGPISGTGGLGCFSGGTMQLGGTNANTYTGTTLVRCPLLELNKPFGVHAYAGPLVVGADVGGPYEVRWLNWYQNPNTSLTLYANGVVNLGWSNVVENFGPVTFNGGTVQTGTGFFIAENTITANPATATATINGNLSLGVSPAYFVVSNGVADPDLRINAVVSGANVIKQGQGTLTLAGINTHSGSTVVSEGILHADNNAAFGSLGGNTTVADGATIRLGVSALIPEHFVLSGSGVGGNSALHVTGSPTIASSIFLNGPSTINVAQTGGLAIDSIISGTGPLTKTGPGNLYLGDVSGGTGNNTYSGSTIVTAGTLYLSKNQNVLSVPGPLIVGPATVASPATARFSRTGTMPAAGTVTVNANSLLDLNGNNQTLASLNLNDGGDVQTGTGQLNFPAGGLVTVGTLNAPQVGLLASSSISGKIGLPVLDYLTVNVGGYGAAPLVPDAELVVPALISGAGNIIKNGAGTMFLSGANTFNDSPPNVVAGDLYIYEGIVIAANSSALGGTAGWTLVYNGARLALVGNITINNETLYLNSTNTTTLDNPGGHNIWLGPIIQGRDSSIGVNLDWSLTVAGTVSGTGSLTKRGAGLLRLGGSANNTHSGDTFVDAGALWLTKFPNMQAVPANLIIGRPEGGSPATVMHVNSDLIWGNVTVNNGGLLNVNGYDEYIGNLTLNGGSDVQTGAGALHITSLAVNPGGFSDQSFISGRLGLSPGTIPFTVGSGSLGPGVADCLVSATIVHSSHVAGLQKTGAGVLQLTANNTYSGTTTVSSGTLQIDGLQPQSPVQVFGGRLQGSGTVGHVIFDETKCFVAPGSSPGILTISNFNATALGGARVEIELNGPSVRGAVTTRLMCAAR